MPLMENFNSYKRSNPRVLQPFHQFALGCPLRLRVNAYVGCGFGCTFCYVPCDPRPFSRDIIKYLKRDIENAKNMGLDVLPVMVSCSTEPFQPIETNCGYSIKVLNLLQENEFSLIIMTQNPQFLVEKLREGGLRLDANNCVVEISIPSMNPKGIFSTGAPPPDNRFTAMQTLVEYYNIPVRLRLDPIIPEDIGGQKMDEIRDIVNGFRTIYEKSPEEIKKEMLIIANVMAFNEDVDDKLKKRDPSLAQKVAQYYNQNGEDYIREDGIRMRILKRGLQEQLLRPLWKVCNGVVPLCTCISKGYFYNTRDCFYPRRGIPYSLENRATEEVITEAIQTSFPTRPREVYETRSLWTADRFLTEDSEFFVSLVGAVFNSDVFKRAIKERKIEKFLKDEDFIRGVLRELLSPNKINLDFTCTYPVLYGVAWPIIRMLNACCTEDKPDVIWGSINFWDELTQMHYGTQFLQYDYFREGDKFIFNKVIEWLLSPNNRHILTITQLFLTDKTNRKVIVLQNTEEEPSAYQNLYRKNILHRIKLTNYKNIIDKLQSMGALDEVKNKISRGENVAEIMEGYLQKLELDDLKGDVSRFTEDLQKQLNQSLEINKDEAQLRRFLNLLVVFSLISPEEWKWIVIYPSFLYTDYPVGGVFLVLHRLLDIPVYQLLRQTVTDLFAIPQILIDKQIFLEKSLNSAVAAIIGRNASHTIGSHALSYLAEVKNLEGKYTCEEISKFFRYLQGRLDYIAEASTTEPKWSHAVGFKSDILIPFIEQKILIDNINRSEYIVDSSGNKVEMRAEKYEFVLKMNNETCSFWYKREPDGKLSLNKKENNSDGDVLIDCPHGIVGHHAFYSFLENFIRNSCKHGGGALKDILADPNKRLQITIEINDDKNYGDLIRIRISDNLGNCTSEVMEKINKYIEGKEKEFCKETGLVRGGAWGIYEMRIGMGWLRQAGIVSISDNLLSPPVLKLDNPKNNITYEFYLLKPLNYLFVTENDGINEDMNRGLYKVKNLSALDELYQAKKLRHRFVIIEVKNKNDIEWLKNRENQIKLPFRTIVFYNNTGDFENDIAGLKNKFVCVKGEIPEIRDIQKHYIEWLSGGKLPKLNIIWGDLNGSEYYKEDLNSADAQAIIYKHGMLTEDIKILKKKNPLFFQPFSSSVVENIVGRKINEYRHNLQNNEIIYELYEVGLFRILVADERIFKKVDEKTIDTLEGVRLDTEHKLWEVWQWMGVDIIDIKKEKNEIYVLTLTGEKKRLADFFGSQQWTIFLIHQGIIDNQLTSDFFIERFVPQYQNCFKRLFIHSGRGEVKIEKGFNFVELSNLESYILDTPNKYRLINLLAKVTGGKEK